MTNEQHNKLLGIAFLVHGGLQFLFMLFMTLMVGSIMLLAPNQPGRPSPPPVFFVPFLSIILLIYSIFAIPSFVAAYGVLKRKSWARLTSIIAAILAAMSVPIGTATCVYALWFFFGENWKEVYEPTTLGPRAQLTRDANEWAGQPWESRRERTTPPTPPDWR